jgi:autotransporter-associated beta strand protein
MITASSLFGGGSGGTGAPIGNGGGGGAGCGGAVFVQTGGTLLIIDPVQSYLFEGNTSVGGTGGMATLTNAGSGLTGNSYGPDLFIQSGGTVNFQPAGTITVSSNIDSDQMAGGEGSGGGVIMSGTGTLILSGTNSYSGSTTLQSGLLQINSDNSLGSFISIKPTALFFEGGNLEITAWGTTTSARPVTFSSPATVTVDPGVAGQFAGLVSGPGDITITGGGTLIFAYTGTVTYPYNTFTGSVTIDPSTTWEIFTGASLPLGTAILNNGTLLFFQNDTATASGNISGNGTLNMLGTGKTAITILSGMNTYAGPTTITTGTLQINTENSLPSGGMVSIDTNGTLAFDTMSGGTSTINSTISGGGNLTMEGTDTLALSGMNTYLGTTTISSGTLLILNDDSLPSTSNVVNNSALVFANAGTLTVNGSIIGTGSVAMQGSGTVVLSGDNTWSGSTTISAGTLEINGTSALPASANVTVDLGATLAFGLQSLTSITVYGMISGMGGVTVLGPGTAIFAGTNSYTGPTTIDLGGTLQLDTAGSLPGASTLLDDGALAFNIPGTYTFSEVINGPTGYVNQVSSGTLILSNTSNSYGGGTGFYNGTIQVTNPLQLGAMTGTFDFNGGTLDIPVGAPSMTFDQSVVWTGAGGTLSVDDASNTLTMAGNMSGAMTGSGSLTIPGPGTVIFSGTNTYTGTTTISGGTLEIESAGGFPLGSAVINDASLIFNFASGTDTLQGAISGTGSLLVEGGGTVALAGENTYSGMTTITGGATLQINANNSASPNTTFLVDTSSGLTFNNTGTATVSALISGAGSVSVINSGTVALTNTSNSYSGGTFISGNGTVSITSDSQLGDTTVPITFNNGTLDIPVGTLSLTVVQPLVVNGPGGVSVDDPSGVVTLTNNITGAGSFASFAKLGPGTLILEGTDTYGGSTIIDAGTLQINAPNNFPAGNNIVDNGILLLTYAGTQTLSGVISGTGSINLMSSGTLILTNTGNSYSGGTFVSNGGTLEITSGFQLGAENVMVPTVTLNNGVLNIPTGSPVVLLPQYFSLTGPSTITVADASNSATLSGNISGIGPLTISGPGTVILSGTNTFGGPLTIQSGTLEIENLDSLPSADDVVDNGSLVFSLPPGIATISGNISGTGGLTMGGTGTLILSGTNTYMGTTTIASGTLQINTGSSLPAGTNVTDNGTLAFGPSGTMTFSGNVSGSGGLSMVGTGTVILSGMNTYLGPTTISSGTLQINAVDSLPATTTNVTDNGSLAFNISGTETFSGTISGSGSVNMISSGTLILTNSGSSYTGGTTISGGGTIEWTADQELGAATGSVTFDTGTLDIPSGTTTLTSARPIVLTGPGNISVDDTAGIVTLSGNITGGGAFTKEGPGTLVLNGDNRFFTGQTTISAGTLQINTSTSFSLNSNVTDNGNFAFDNTGFITLSGNISGSGSLTMEGLGTLILTGMNNYTGGTTITTGTLQINSIGSLPASYPITDNGYLVFNQTGTETVSGLISGTGFVKLISAGTLALTNNTNSYTGGTSISNGGTLEWTNDHQLGSPLASILLSHGTLDIPVGTLSLTSARPINLSIAATVSVDDPSGVVTLSGNINGGGSLTKEGPGTLIVSGINNFSGPLTIAAGTFQVNSADGIPAPSNIVDNASLIFNNSGTANIEGNISGSGTLLMEGTGTVILSGTDTYTGQTTVQSGILIVNGSVTSNILVESGGELEGTGTVNNAVIDGIISPGNSIGTLSGVSFTLNASSSYDLEFNNTTSDRIAATSTVTINGGKLVITPYGFTQPLVSSYTIITAPTVTTNAPFTVINPFPLFHFTVQYDPTKVLLLLAGVPPPFPVIVPSGNPGAAAVCFQTVVDQNPSSVADVLAVLYLQTAGQIKKSIDQMQPANLNTIAFAEENVAERIRQVYTKTERIGTACPALGNWQVWAVPFVEKTTQRGNAGLPGYSEFFAGFTAACDWRMREHWMMTFGYSMAFTQMDTSHASANFTTYAVTVGAEWTDSAWFAEILGSYLFNSVKGKRSMKFYASSMGFSEELSLTAHHRTGTSEGLVSLGGGWVYQWPSSTTNTFETYPFINLDYIYISQNTLKEHGAGSLDLTINAKNYDYLRPEAGIGFSYKGCFQDFKAMADASISYVHEFRFLGKSTKASFAPTDCTFRVAGLKPQNRLISPDVRLSFGFLDDRWTASLGYHGEFGNHFTLNAGEAELRYSF